MKTTIQNERKSSVWLVLVLTGAIMIAALQPAVAQGLYPPYDFRQANPDGDTLYYRITSSVAPYTVAVTRCHDSAYHSLPFPYDYWEVGQPGFVYPVYDYDALITIPSSVTHGGLTYAVTSVDKEAFFMQKNMHTVVLPASIETIDTGAFHHSTLHQIVMSANVKRINYYAFMSTPLASIELPSGLTHIGTMAFENTSLSEVEIPGGVEVLPYHAFYRCPLTRVTFHDGLREIQKGAVDPTHIDSLLFPGTLRKIALGENNINGDEVFCEYVEFANGADSLEIADFCFFRFQHLKKAILPDNTFLLGESCFEGTALEQVVIPQQVKAIPKCCFYGCHLLSSVTMPPQLETIEQGAFFETPMLQGLSLPATVSYIGKQAFRTLSDRGLRTLDIYCEQPPALGSAVFNTSDSIIVRVPCGSTSLYQQAPGWQNYSNIYYEECVGVREPTLYQARVYPNPTGNTLHVECASFAAGSHLEIVDALGHRILTAPVQSDNTMVDISRLKEGVYVLLILDNNGVQYREKIIKGHSY